MKTVTARIAKTMKAATVAVALISSLDAPAQLAWTDANPLNSYASLDGDPSHQSRPELCADNRGNVMALWEQPEEGHTLLNVARETEELQVALSADNGQTWGAPVNIPDTNLVNFKALAYAGGDTWVVAYSAEDEQRPYSVSHVFVVVSSDNGRTWPTPRFITSGEPYSSRPRHIEVASNGSGNVIVTWLGRGGTAHAVTSQDFGQTWSDVAPLAPATGLSLNGAGVQLAYAGNQRWLGLFSTANDRIMYSLSTDNAQSWTSPELLRQGGPGEIDDLAVVGDEAVATVWSPEGWSFTKNTQQWGTEAYGLYAFHLNLAGPVTHSVNQLDKPENPSWDLSMWDRNMTASVAGNAAGQWVITADSFSALGKVKSWQLNPVAAEWNQTLTINEEAVENRYPDVAAAVNGQFIHANQRTAHFGDIWERDADITYSASVDGGTTWNTPAFLNHNALTDEAWLDDTSAHMAADGAGTVVAAWVAEPHRSIASIMVARSTSNGETFDQAVSLASLSPAEAGMDQDPQVISEGNGQWLARWTQPAGKTYYSRSTDDGKTWSARQPGSGLTPAADDPQYVVPPVTYNGIELVLNQVVTGSSGMVIAVLSSGEEYFSRSVTSYVMVSQDNGSTWSNPMPIHTSQQVTAPHVLYYEMTPTLLWLENGHWALFMHHLVTGRDLPLSTFNYVISSKVFVVESADNGTTWTSAILAAEEFDPIMSPRVKFFNSGRKVFGVWERENYPQEFGEDRDILYKTVWLGDPPPPVNGPNLTATWVQPEVEYKTKKNGILKASMKATLLIANNGSLPTSEKTSVQYYLSDDVVLDAGDVPLKPKKLGKLKDGKVKTATVKLKSDSMLTGKHLIAVVDPEAAVAEPNEDDNVVISIPLM